MQRRRLHGKRERKSFLRTVWKGEEWKRTLHFWNCVCVFGVVFCDVRQLRSRRCDCEILKK